MRIAGKDFPCLESSENGLLTYRNRQRRRVIFSKLEEKKFIDFTASDIVSTNEILGIKFDDKAIESDTNLLLHYNCPADDCIRACRGWPDLHHHVRSAHSRILW